jgi:mannose-6-phosphate isomerase
MAEVQQTSDATFRLFDWNRRDAQGGSRTLHIDQGLACIDWKAGPVHPVRAEGYADGSGRVAERLVSCPYFTLDYVRDSQPFPVGGGRMHVLIVVQGRGSLHGPAGRCDLRTGDSLLLPAGCAPLECRPDGPLGLLLVGLP